MKHGRKFVLAVTFLLLSAVLMVASFVLAVKNLLSDKWVSLANVWLMCGSAVLAAFSGANAFVAGRALTVDSKISSSEPTSRTEGLQ